MSKPWHTTSHTLEWLITDNKKKCQWGCGDVRTLGYTASGDVTWCSPFGRQSGSSSSEQTQKYIWSSSSAPRCIPKRNEHICPAQNLYMYVYSSIIRNSQTLETTQMSINRAMEKQNMVYLYDGILLNLKKELSADTGCKGKPRKHAEWKKPVTKDGTLCDFVQEKVPLREFYTDRK